MVMPEITIGVTGQKAVSQRLQVAADVIGDLTPVWDDVVHPWFLRHMRRQFETSGSHGGDTWAGYEDEPIYRAVKLKLTGYLQLLRWDFENERLYPSLTDPSHPDHVYQRSEQSMSTGTSVEYAPRLIEGGEGPFGETYPGRNMISVTDRQRSDLVRAITRYLAPKIREARIVRSR